MKKIKVCELVDTYYPTVDGVINVVKHYSKLLHSRVECKLAAPRPAKKDNYVDREEFEVIRCNSAKAPEGYRVAAPQSDSKFVSKMDSEDFDILHVHSPFTMGRYAIKAGKKNAVPVVATLHTQYHQDFARVAKGNKLFIKIALAYIMHVYNRADSVWTVSNRSGDFLRMYGYKGKITVIRNGTDYVYPENDKELIDRVNQIHGLENQENVYLFVGRMAWYKNIRLIIDALKIAKDDGKDFKMLFVGSGFDFDEVKEYVTELGLDDKCIFTGQISDRQLLQGYYLRSDLMLFPSTFDMASIVKEEAAAHKLPCLVVKDSCSAERVIDNQNGFLCLETAESVAERMIELMDKPELVKEVGENAFKTLYRNWDDVLNDVLAEYQKIIEEYKANMTDKQREKYLKKRAKAEKRAMRLQQKLLAK